MAICLVRNRGTGQRNLDQLLLGSLAALLDGVGNFRRLASQQDVPMSTAWMFLAGKHIDSIQEYVKDCRANVRRDRTQSIAERIDDLIVYSLLLHVIAEEEQA